MVKYTFVIEATISMHTEVEADSLKKAIKIAQSRPTQSLCWQCSKGEEECAWSTSGEFDADPSGSPLVEVYADGEDMDELLSAAQAEWEK